MGRKWHAINHPLLKELILNSKESAAKIAKLVSCTENTVRTTASKLGSGRFKQKKFKPLPPRHHNDKGCYNYLSDLRAGFPEDVRKLEGLSCYINNGVDVTA